MATDLAPEEGVGGVQLVHVRGQQLGVGLASKHHLGNHIQEALDGHVTCQGLRHAAVADPHLQPHRYVTQVLVGGL